MEHRVTKLLAGNHDNSGSDDLTLSIGTVQIDKVGLKNGGVFDWEITDFAGNNADGSDWDILKFDSLQFDEDSDTFDINIYSSHRMAVPEELVGIYLCQKQEHRF